MSVKKMAAKKTAKPRQLSAADVSEILVTSAHIPDRDQEFYVNPAADLTGRGERWIGGLEEHRMKGAVDVDEGDTGVVSDPAYNRDGAERMLRAAAGDRTVEDHMLPAARAGTGGSDDPRGIEHLSLEELRQRAQALNVPGRAKMTKPQLSAAVHDAMQH